MGSPTDIYLLIGICHLCCRIVKTSGKTSAVPEADGDTEDEDRLETEGVTEDAGEGESEGERWSEPGGVGGHVGDDESTNTISETQHSSAVTHWSYDTPEEGGEK